MNIGPDEVESSWAGLRPLIHEDGKSPTEISRKDEIFVSESGLISIAGGKLTGYRKMAEHVLDVVVMQLNEEQGRQYPGSRTKHLPISGGDLGGADGFRTFVTEKVEEGRILGLSKELSEKLIHRYGSNVDTVFFLFKNGKSIARTKDMDPLVYAQLRYSIDHELIYKPTDFFIRRTGALYFDLQWVQTHKETVCRFLEQEFNWTEEQAVRYAIELEDAINDATLV